jgi:hypothetical protein
MWGGKYQTQIEVLNRVKSIKFKEYDLKIQELSEKLNKLDIKEKYLRSQNYKV